MFFDKEDIIPHTTGKPTSIEVNTFMDRVTTAIRDRFVQKDRYTYKETVRLDEAEDFMMKMYHVLKER